MVVGREVGTGVEVAITRSGVLAGAGGLLDSTGLFEVSGADAVGDADTGGPAGVAADVQAIKNMPSSTSTPRITQPMTFRLMGA
jgi:hypothetical protein